MLDCAFILLTPPATVTGHVSVTPMATAYAMKTSWRAAWIRTPATAACWPPIVILACAAMTAGDAHMEMQRITMQRRPSMMARVRLICLRPWHQPVMGTPMEMDKSASWTSWMSWMALDLTASDRAAPFLGCRKGGPLGRPFWWNGRKRCATDFDEAAPKTRRSFNTRSRTGSKPQGCHPHPRSRLHRHLRCRCRAGLLRCIQIETAPAECHPY